MARYKIANNAEINLLTQSELDTSLDRVTKDWYQEAARGVSTARFSAIATVAASAVTLPGSDQQRIGPKDGFAWAVQRVTAAGLSTNDQLLVYRNSVSALNLVGVITPTASLHPGSKGLILRNDETLIAVGSSLTATGDIVINGEAVELPELDIFKLL